ncbi:MAG: hypothetical protein JWP31_691 [Aeromicrobium sp.]|nr:hypothetical protein [Aeromicrobium sp.]
MTKSGRNGLVTRVKSRPRVTTFTLWDDHPVARQRIVVGSTGDDETARRTARSLRDLGHEVVFVGGRQNAEQLVRTAVSEDATRIVVAAAPDALVEIAALARASGLDDIAVDEVSEALEM